MSSDEAVKRVLAGEKVDIKTKAATSRSQDKENREGRERHLDKGVRVVRLDQREAFQMCYTLLYPTCDV